MTIGCIHKRHISYTLYKQIQSHTPRKRWWSHLISRLCMPMAYKVRYICSKGEYELVLEITHFISSNWNVINHIMYYYLYQAIWRSNTSVHLILSGKSTRMRTILYTYCTVIIPKWPPKSSNCIFLDFCNVYRMK